MTFPTAAQSGADASPAAPASVGALSLPAKRSARSPLRDEPLKFGPARGVSNVIVEAPAKLRFTQGKLLVVHTVGRA